MADCEGYDELTAPELRVLVALIEAGGAAESYESLANAAGVSIPRCRSAVTMLESIGIIMKEEAALSLPSDFEVNREESAGTKTADLDENENGETQEFATVTEEFEYRLRHGEIEEVPSVEVARSIRDSGLAEMYSECERLFGRTLNTDEIKILEALHTQYGLSPEYILTYASYLSTKHKVTPQMLKVSAIKMFERGYDTVEALEGYIERAEKENGDVWELKRMLGINGRALSDAELKYVDRWYREFGFSTEIISEAYGISAIGTSKISFPYMDKVLEKWHGAGCKSLEDCKRFVLREREENKAQAAEKKKRTKPKSEPKKPRYGSFDIDEAFRAALTRSFGDDGTEGENK